MKRVAVIFEGNLNERMGVFNAVVNRVKHLQAIAPFAVDLYMMQFTSGPLMRLLRHDPAAAAGQPATVEEGGLTLNMLWVRRSLADALGHRLLGSQPHAFQRQCQRLALTLGGYSLVMAHDLLPAMLARAMQRRWHIPMTITWHGTSLNTAPFSDGMLMRATRQLLAQAQCNVTVSHAMSAVARKICPDCTVQVVPNGASDQFFRYSDHRRQALRRQWSLRPEVQVVAFVGRHAADKNVALLPSLFQAIGRYAHGPLAFWTLGDGPLRQQLQQDFARAGLEVKMWGAQPVQAMPDFYNCIDLLVLPSRMEGLPLVAVEAMRCGAHVVASRVGGTPEVAGSDNCFPLNEGFVEAMARRGAQLLRAPQLQQLPQGFTWQEAAQSELALCRRLLQQP